MPALPLTRPLLTAAAALITAALASTTPTMQTAPAGPSETAASAQAAQDADNLYTAQARAAKDQAVRSGAAAAAEAKAAQEQAAAQARAATARAAARSKARTTAKAKAAKVAQARAAKTRAAARARSVTKPQAANRTAPARTSWAALNRAIAAIPGYRSGIAKWHVTTAYGHYGLTDANQPGAANIYISPNVPANLLYSVAAHEYGHAVVIANYGTGYGPYTEYSRDMVSWFGGDRVSGLERAADCMARQLGASWTNYTGCADPHWRKGAAILLGGGRL